MLMNFNKMEVKIFRFVLMLRSCPFVKYDFKLKLPLPSLSTAFIKTSKAFLKSNSLEAIKQLIEKV